MTTPAGRPARSLDVLMLLAALLAIGCGVAWFMARQGAPAVSSTPVEALSSLAIDAQGAVAGETRALNNFESALKDLRAAAAAAPKRRSRRIRDTRRSSATPASFCRRAVRLRMPASPRVRRGTSCRSCLLKSARSPAASRARTSKPRLARSNASKCAPSVCSSTWARWPPAPRIRARSRSVSPRAPTTSVR